MVFKTVGALAQIKAAAPNYTGSHCTTTCHVNHEASLLKNVLDEAIKGTV